MSLEITLEVLRSKFHLPEKEVANELGICLTSLKKICRAVGVSRWPYRKLKSLQRTMKQISEQNSKVSAMTNAHTMPDEYNTQLKFETTARTGSPLIAAPNACTPIPSVSVDNALVEDNPCKMEMVDLNDVQRDVLISLEEQNWPKCRIMSSDNHTTEIHNWSSLWTPRQLRRCVLEVLGGTSMRFTECGGYVHLSFTTPMAAMQARALCVEATEILRRIRDSRTLCKQEREYTGVGAPEAVKWAEFPEPSALIGNVHLNALHTPPSSGPNHYFFPTPTSGPRYSGFSVAPQNQHLQALSFPQIVTIPQAPATLSHTNSEACEWPCLLSY